MYLVHCVWVSHLSYKYKIGMSMVCDRRNVYQKLLCIIYSNNDLKKKKLRKSSSSWWGENMILFLSDRIETQTTEKGTEGQLSLTNFSKHLICQWDNLCHIWELDSWTDNFSIIQSTFWQNISNREIHINNLPLCLHSKNKICVSYNTYITY